MKRISLLLLLSLSSLCHGGLLDGMKQECKDQCKAAAGKVIDKIKQESFLHKFKGQDFEGMRHAVQDLKNTLDSMDAVFELFQKVQKYDAPDMVKKNVDFYQSLLNISSRDQRLAATMSPDFSKSSKEAFGQLKRILINMTDLGGKVFLALIIKQLGGTPKVDNETGAML